MFSPEQRADVRFDAVRRRVSLIEIFDRCAAGRFHEGAQAEYLQETARAAGRGYDQTAPILDWQLFRADTVGSAAAGGYLVESEVQTVIDILRPWSVVAKAGVSAMPGLTGNVSMPRLAGTVTAAWLAAETSGVTDTASETIGSIGLTPHSAAATVKFSRQLLLQAPGAEAMVRNDLARTLGTLIDTAVLSGSGSAGQPLGVLNTGGIGSVSLTSTTWATAVSMKTTLSNASCLNDGSLGFLSNPTVHGALEGRDKSGASSGRYIIEDDRIAGIPAYSTTAIPAATLICARWSDVTLASWGPGFEVVVTPYGASSDFQAGVFSARIMASVDVGVRHLGAVIAGNNFT
jgi:HK97 family phage major capsid protein